MSGDPSLPLPPARLLFMQKDAEIPFNGPHLGERN